MALAALTLLAATALTATATVNSAYLPSFDHTLRLEGGLVEAPAQDGAGAASLSWDGGRRNGAAGWTFGASAGASWLRGAGGLGPSSGGMQGQFGLRAGGVFALHGWNLAWPGELLLTSEIDLRYDRRHPHFDGAGLAPRLGLRALLGFGGALIGRVDLDAAPLVFADGRDGAEVAASLARLRVAFGWQRAQLVVSAERGWGHARAAATIDPTRTRTSLALTTVQIGLQLGLGASR